MNEVSGHDSVCLDLQVSYLMAAESSALGQLRQIPSSSIVSSSFSFSEPRPPLPADPLQGLVQEMALSAVMQKHGSSVQPTAHTTHTSNGALINNYVIPAAPQANSSMVITPSSGEPIVAHTPQSAGLMQLGAAGSSSFIALSNAQAGAGNMSLLGHPQASPVLQGSPVAFPQLAGQIHEVGATNVVQFTPVCCYEGAGSTQPSPVVERSPMLQSNFVG